MSSDRSFAISRSFEGPAERVFNLWVDPRKVSRWWGIAGSKIVLCELDVRVGGCWRIDMRTASGRTYRNGGEYLEIVPNERLVYSDKPDPTLVEWNGIPPGHSRHTVTFRDDGATTLVNLEIDFVSEADCRRLLRLGMDSGWEQSFDRLESLARDLGRSGQLRSAPNFTRSCVPTKERSHDEEHSELK